MRTPLRTRLAAGVLTAIGLLAGAAWAQPGAPGPPCMRGRNIAATTRPGHGSA